MSWVPKEFYYPLFFGFMWIFILVLIPKDKLKGLFFYGLVWGFLAAYPFIWIFAEWLHLFEYFHAEPFKVFGVNLLLAGAWIPAIMLFLYYLPSDHSRYARPLYFLIFALASASIDGFFHSVGLLKYYFWSPWFRYIISLIWFWGAYKHFLWEHKKLGIQNR